MHWHIRYLTHWQTGKHACRHIEMLAYTRPHTHIYAYGCIYLYCRTIIFKAYRRFEDVSIFTREIVYFYWWLLNVHFILHIIVNKTDFRQKWSMFSVNNDLWQLIRKNVYIYILYWININVLMYKNVFSYMLWNSDIIVLYYGNTDSFYLAGIKQNMIYEVILICHQYRLFLVSLRSFCGITTKCRTSDIIMKYISV